MKRRMEQLLNGRFEYEVPKLTLSDTQINLTTNEGENVGENYMWRQKITAGSRE